MTKHKRKSQEGGDEHPHGPPRKKVHGDRSPPPGALTVAKTKPRPTPGCQYLPPLPPINDQYKERVFTHPSSAEGPLANYDRLEFLGDAHLEMISSQMIYDRFSDLEVGKMCRIRESLVSNENIGQYTVLYGLDRQMKDFKRLRNLSPQAWLKIKGDIFEAYLAAVVLSSPTGYSTAREWLLKLWEPKIAPLLAKPVQPSKQSKLELARMILGNGTQLDYVEEKPPVLGKGTETYCIGVYLSGWGWEKQFLGSGKGLSKSEAGQVAAQAAMDNHPLIDMIVAKREAFYAQRAEAQKGQEADIATKKESVTEKGFHHAEAPSEVQS